MSLYTSAGVLVLSVARAPFKLSNISLADSLTSPVLITSGISVAEAANAVKRFPGPKSPIFKFLLNSIREAWCLA